jgi:L-cysteate sulfo-lyase
MPPRGIDALPRASLLSGATPVEELPRLRAALGRAPQLLMKRDDAIPFGLGGNKARKLEYFAGRAVADKADALVTCGGLQSNHVRVTAATAAKLGLKAVLILTREPRDRRSNPVLDKLLGAEIHYVGDREERAQKMRQMVEGLRERGGRPFEIPLDGSTSLGAMGFVRAVQELVRQGVHPDAIVHPTSSGGTQAGLMAGCALAKLETRVLGISADTNATLIGAEVDRIIQGMAQLIDIDRAAVLRDQEILVADEFVGEGFGIPTDASREAAQLVARTEGIFLDPAYTAKAMAGLIQLIKQGTFSEQHTVLFWHTGGLPAVFR